MSSLPAIYSLPHDRIILTSTHTATLAHLHQNTYTPILTTPPVPSPITTSAYSNGFLALGLANGSVNLHSLREASQASLCEASLTNTLPVTSTPMQEKKSLSLSLTPTSIALCLEKSPKGSLQIYTLTRPTSPVMTLLPREKPSCCAFLTAEELVVGVPRTGVKIVDIRHGEIVQDLAMRGVGGLTSTGDGTVFASVGQEEMVLWDRRFLAAGGVCTVPGRGFGTTRFSQRGRLGAVVEDGGLGSWEFGGCGGMRFVVRRRVFSGRGFVGFDWTDDGFVGVKRDGTVERVGWKNSVIGMVTGRGDLGVCAGRLTVREEGVGDVSTRQRERCGRGYLWDCARNIEIVGEGELKVLWEVVGRFTAQTTEMRKGDVDLSYLGVSYLWTERLGNEKRRVRNQKATMNSAIHAWGKNVPAFEGERTSFPEHRQLCLAVCGWAFTAETLEDECQQMIDRGEPYEAIFRAVLHDKKQIALNLLRTLVRTRVVDNSALGPLLACGEVNETQRDMCLWMAADVENATLKALLGFLATGSWVEAIKTKQLPLANRLCLALKHLNDTDLSKFIEDETARAIREGDVQGVLLTGVNEAAMDLFQSYIARTDDVQTAVLATAYANYSSDIRWVMWKESYMQQMQTWHCFSERARFRIELSKIKDKAGLPTPAKQIGLRCHRCHAGLKRPANQGTPVKPPLAQSGTVCPLCGQHMPRCVICRQWLGMESRLLCFCTGCGHASHVDHANAWFERHATCPQPQCECQCLWEAKSRLPAD